MILGLIKTIKNLGFVLKQAKREKVDPSRKLIVCPACNKASLKKMPSSISGWLTAPMYFCTRSECNYSGYIYAEIIVEDDTELEDHQSAQSEVETRDE